MLSEWEDWRQPAFTLRVNCRCEARTADTWRRDRLVVQNKESQTGEHKCKHLGVEAKT